MREYAHSMGELILSAQSVTLDGAVQDSAYGLTVIGGDAAGHFMQGIPLIVADNLQAAVDVARGRFDHLDVVVTFPAEETRSSALPIRRLQISVDSTEDAIVIEDPTDESHPIIATTLESAVEKAKSRHANEHIVLHLPATR